MMKIRSHSESHVVELDDGSVWQIFPGDLDMTLGWKPESDLQLERISGDISTHALISTSDQSRVRVIPAGENWPVQEVENALKEEVKPPERL
jgi:hypothetical protein